MQRRDPVRNGTQVQLSRTFSQGQLVYTAPITIQNQNMHVEVDTGSSDLVSELACRAAGLGSLLTAPMPISPVGRF